MLDEEYARRSQRERRDQAVARQRRQRVRDSGRSAEGLPVHPHTKSWEPILGQQGREVSKETWTARRWEPMGHTAATWQVVEHLANPTGGDTPGLTGQKAFLP